MLVSGSSPRAGGGGKRTTTITTTTRTIVRRKKIVKKKAVAMVFDTRPTAADNDGENGGGARANGSEGGGGRRGSLVDRQHPHLNARQLRNLDLDAGIHRTDGEGGRYTKPKQVYCYLCAREFGTRSLKIHWPACVRRFEAASRRAARRDERRMASTPRKHSQRPSNFSL